MTTTISRPSSPSKTSLALGKVWQAIFPPALFIGVVLTVWQLLCLSEDSALPGPIKVIAQTIDPYLINPFFDNGGTDKGLGWQILISLQRVLMGYALAAIVGVAVGAVVGGVPFVRKGLDPIIQVLRTVPPLAWMPLALLFFQNNDRAAIYVIFITAVWPIIINTALGVQQIPSDYKNVARVLQLSLPEYVMNILVPATVPYVFSGLRIGIGLSWLAIVAAEMLKADGGIGFFIWDAYNAGNDNSTSQIILAIVVVGLVGLLLDKIVAWVGRLVAPGEQR
ncbi:MAG: nitrate ABC transporter permease [Oscillatoriophycideae cyanobacterium NC_groundwater_1537_Pr4_S-0.65um_50_18]|nr:nitrate ABC transporter permease [Oscillatoriophycideae cyanobacterium NC_groundwater_1537_Pr4_S-0.65um_50_18]